MQNKINKKWVFIVFLIVSIIYLNYFAKGNTIDSLRSIIKNANDYKTIIDNQLELARQYWAMNIDSAKVLVSSSLEKSYKNNYFAGIKQAEYLMGFYYHTEDNYDSSKYYLNLCKPKFDPDKDSSKYKVINDMLSYSNVIQNDYNSALKIDFEMVEYYKRKKNMSQLMLTYIHISGTYIFMDENLKALNFALKALELSIQTKDIKYELSSICNMAIIHRNILNYGKALEYFHQCLQRNKKLNDIDFEYNTYLNLFQTYMEMKDYTNAEKNLNLAYGIINKVSDYNAKLYLAILNAELMEKQNQFVKAIEFFKKGYEIAKNISFLTYQVVCEVSLADNYINKLNDLKEGKKYILLASKNINTVDNHDTKSIYYKTIAEYYKRTGDYKNAYINIEFYKQEQDSINNVQAKRLIANNEYNRENEIKQKQIDLANLKSEKERTLKYYFFTGLIIVVIFIVILMFMFINKIKINKILSVRNSEIKSANEVLNKLNIVLEDKNEEINIEKEKSDNLLLNILPQPIANRLKEGEQVIADHYANASVVFIDIVNFTNMTAKQSPEKTVDMLNSVFTEFDKLSEKFGLEKIKTIGDSYMAVSGIPDEHDDHAIRAIEFAKSAINIFDNSELDLKFRCGIDSGPVVAGVIGTKKFIYDLWGDTVNTASRMEEYGIEKCIQVTENVIKALDNDKFDFKYRGEIDIKGKGLMKTWII